jgi:glycosyltransferase involved in cell wall biosynthesis
MNDKKVLFIGHSYHKKTASSKFLEQLLQEKYDVECIYDESWLHSKKATHSFSLNLNDYFAIIIWQIADLLSKDFIAELSKRNTVFFPMENYGDDWSRWKRYKKFKIISFSKFNYIKLKQWGFDVQYFQYFPKSWRISSETKKKRYTVFFWQRVNALTWGDVKRLINHKDIEKVVLHKSVDPGHQFVMPSEADIKKYNIEITEWFNNKAELENKIAQADIYIAPRITEGIGLSFLEAMAMGKAVIAVNMPTMNEYIKDKKNGYLFNMNNIHRVDLRNIETIRKNCIKSMERGFEKWSVQKEEIYKIVERNYSPNRELLLAQISKEIYRKTVLKAKRILKEAAPFVFVRLRQKYLR